MIYNPAINISHSPAANSQVLIVEDDEINAELLYAILSSANYKVTKTADAFAAWQKLEDKKNNFDLVITDKLMPGIDGLEFFQKMKSHEVFSSIPVIMQTSYGKSEDMIKGINAGLFYYLTKPYERDVLLSLVNAAVREYRQKKKFDELLQKNKLVLGNFNLGEFSFRTLEEAQNIAAFLASLFPNPRNSNIGLYELMLNAIEHGNLGIGYELKTRLLAENLWEEEINKRLAASKKEAKLRFENGKKKIQVTVIDNGKGFDWRPYMKIEPARATNNHGRGIAKANLLCFDEVKYAGEGNSVTCSVNL